MEDLYVDMEELMVEEEEELAHQKKQQEVAKEIMIRVIAFILPVFGYLALLPWAVILFELPLVWAMAILVFVILAVVVVNQQICISTQKEHEGTRVLDTVTLSGRNYVLEELPLEGYTPLTEPIEKIKGSTFIDMRNKILVELATAFNDLVIREGLVNPPKAYSNANKQDSKDVPELKLEELSDDNIKHFTDERNKKDGGFLSRMKRKLFGGKKNDGS
ncbi:MAG: hypothetical protein ACTSPL_03945 [Candidatus Odinarchaeia archaeon]